MERETIEAHRTGPEYPIYQPHAPDPLRFLWVKINTTGALGYRNDRQVPWVQKLALMANDALNNHSREIGVDGYFFASLATSSYIKRTGSEKHSFFYFPQDHRHLLGPALFFSRYNRSDRERQAWRKATIEEKLQLQSLFWKSQAVSDRSPVYPIWANSLIDPGSRSPTTLTRFFQTTAFPSLQNLQEHNLRNTTIHPNLNIVTGAACQMFEGKILVCQAEEMRKEAREVTRGLMSLSFRITGRETGTCRWAREKVVEHEDQITGFIRIINQMRLDNPEHMMPYEEAHSWAPVAAFKYHSPDSSFFPPEPVPDTDSQEEEMEAIKKQVPDYAWPDKRYKLEDRFRDMVPFDFTDQQRDAFKGGQNFRWTDEEENLLKKLFNQGYANEEVYQYLPLIRTSTRCRKYGKDKKKYHHNRTRLPDSENRLIQRYINRDPVEPDNSKRPPKRPKVVWSQEEDLFMLYCWDTLGFRVKDINKLLPYMPKWRAAETIESRFANINKKEVRAHWVKNAS
ncbi:hypothetical protein Q7P37_000192 [Cladosporium fusiforme]